MHRIFQAREDVCRSDGRGRVKRRRNDVKKRQTACKPGSVHALADAGRPFLWDAPRGAPRATNPGGGAGTPSRLPSCDGSAGRPYSVLLPVGFTVPPPLPGARCALAAPFHPCPRGQASLARAVCFLWHCPWGRPRRPLAGTVFPVEPGLSSNTRKRASAAVQPSGGAGMARGLGARQEASAASVPRITVACADSTPPLPCTIAVSAPATWRSPHDPRSWRTASIRISRPYMPGWQ